MRFFLEKDSLFQIMVSNSGFLELHPLEEPRNKQSFMSGSGDY